MGIGQELEEVKTKFYEHVKELQNAITAEMKRLDPTLSIVDEPWERTDAKGVAGGGGITRAFEGELFENAGVNTSCIFGAIDSQFAKTLEGTGESLWAAGISLIIHPRNPKIPTVHANFRLIHQGDRFWFGGGADLTPYYPYPEDFKHFHQVWKEASLPFGIHQDFKQRCDHYFVNHHRLFDGRAEMRGVGGIFFDHYNSGDLDHDFTMAIELSKNFIRSYFPLVEKRKLESWSSEDEDFQLHRRGRYVEFNLLHDRGTLFGLKTNGRIDSILISLPKRCKFSYKYEAKIGTPQREMMNYYFPREWC